MKQFRQLSLPFSTLFVHFYLTTYTESLDASSKTYAELIREGWAIRYRLLNKLVTIRPNARTQSEQNWNLLQHYVGTYTCYYIRLSKQPPSFETSRIVVNPDGTATLRQHSSSEVARGVVKVKDNRLWFYFGENDITGREPVRFLVYNTKAAEKDPLLKGIFQSETLTDKALVSGRMLMQRHSGTKKLPELISIPHDELEARHIKTEFLPFFTGDEHKSLTDGPFWKEINNRFARHRDLIIINDLRRAGEYFYYYVFKNISTSNKKEFVLERNRLVLNADGTVVINSAYCDYTGTASYRRKTIKLSMVDEERGNGFLEIFLDYDYDATPSPKDSRILYGASLWHSGNRIESKAVVLSRIESAPDGNEWTELASETAKLHFLLPQGNQNELNELDAKTRGVVAYLRGEHNRYLQIPRQIPQQLSYTEMRPRDRTSREPHFLAACYLGSLMNKSNPVAEPSSELMPGRFFVAGADEEPLTDLKAIKEACIDQLKQAFLHGYACDFAGLRLEPEQAKTNSDYVLTEYRKAFPSVVPNADYTRDTVKRIQEIAAEQLDLKKAFGPKGPLNVDELRTFAADYWPRLLNVSDSPDAGTAQSTDW